MAEVAAKHPDDAPPKPPAGSARIRQPSNVCVATRGLYAGFFSTVASDILIHA